MYSSCTYISVLTAFNYLKLSKIIIIAAMVGVNKLQGDESVGLQIVGIHFYA